MKYPQGSSKFEVRSSSENRGSKLEKNAGWALSLEDLPVRRSGNAKSPAAMVMQEEAQAASRAPLQELGERTARFGESIIRFAKRISQSPVNNRLIDQLVGAGTSVGANYCEATDALSSKDFKKSIGICRKEAKECLFFLRMVASTEPALAEEARALWREARELNLIFGAIWRKG